MRILFVIAAAALISSTGAWAQASGEETQDGKLELMQRHIEALEEQNRLLKEQIESSSQIDSTHSESSIPQIESHQTQPSEETENSNKTSHKSPVKPEQLSPSMPSVPIETTKSQTPEPPRNSAQHDEKLVDQLLAAVKRGNIGYKEFAGLYNYYEVWFCREIAYLNIKKMKLNGNPPDAYSRIQEAIEVWDFGLPTWSEGIRYGAINEKFEKMHRDDQELLQRWGLYHEDPLIAGDPNLHMLETFYAQSSKALAHCSDTMPTNKREANSRFAKTKSMAKALWSGDQNAFLSFDSVLTDHYQILQDYDIRNRLPKSQAVNTDTKTTKPVKSGQLKSSVKANNSNKVVINDTWTGWVYPDKNDKTKWIYVTWNEKGANSFKSFNECKAMARLFIKALKKNRETKAAIKNFNPTYECGLNCKGTYIYYASEVEKLMGHKDIQSLESLNGFHDCEKLRK